MKKAIIIISLVIGSYYIFPYFIKVKDPVEEVQPIKSGPDISVLFGDDVSASGKKNGVELISSPIFNPYFDDIHRNIDLYFGCISDMSARKLLHVHLAKASFKKPLIPKLDASLVQKKELKEKYTEDLKKYISDSVQYFIQRESSILRFKYLVDSTEGSYRNNLTNTTDLITVISIAEKVFNYPSKDPTQNFLILNSDGKDSHGRSIKQFKGSAKIILVNASGNNHTSIDSILTTTLESPEQAIQYSLHN